MHSLSNRIRIGLFFMLAFALAGIARADGPVVVTALPGGGNVVTDSDNGNGQQWGRSGGRNITYHVSNPSGFATLTFGVVNNTNPSLAFDSAVTPSTGEIMSFTAGQSSLGSGMARWTGSALLQLTGGTATIPTRFTMTLVRASDNAPLPLAFDSAGASPGASVVASGDFKVNLLFEMQFINTIGGDNSWRPVLDLYDALPTPPGSSPASNTGPVMTGVSTGFYFTGAGMTLEEHDAHITAELAPIKTQLGFLYTDWPLRWNGIQSDIGTIKSDVENNLTPTINQIAQNVTTLLGSSGGTSNLATRNDIQGLQQMFLVLWGLMPCPNDPQAQQMCASAKFIRDLATQASVDGVRADTQGILIGLNQVHADTQGILIGLNQARTKIDTLATQTSVDGILIGLNNAVGGLATQSSVNALDAKVGALQTSLGTAQTKLDELQDSLDNAASAALDVRATQVDSPNSKQLRWIVKITRDGTLVNASLIRFATFRTGKAPTVMANVLGNATVVTLTPGLQEVTLDLVKDVTDGGAYFFEAAISSGGVTIQGNAVVATEKK